MEASQARSVPNKKHNGKGKKGADMGAMPSSDGAETAVDLTHSSSSDNDDDGEAGQRGQESDEDGLGVRGSDSESEPAQLKTNGEANKRGIRVTSPPSPSPKKGRLT